MRPRCSKTEFPCKASSWCCWHDQLWVWSFWPKYIVRFDAKGKTLGDNINCTAEIQVGLKQRWEISRCADLQLHAPILYSRYTKLCHVDMASKHLVFTQSKTPLQPITEKVKHRNFSGKTGSLGIQCSRCHPNQYQFMVEKAGDPLDLVVYIDLHVTGTKGCGTEFCVQLWISAESWSIKCVDLCRTLLQVRVLEQPRCIFQLSEFLSHVVKMSKLGREVEINKFSQRTWHADSQTCHGQHNRYLMDFFVFCQTATPFSLVLQIHLESIYYPWTGNGWRWRNVREFTASWARCPSFSWSSSPSSSPASQMLSTTR